MQDWKVFVKCDCEMVRHLEEHEPGMCTTHAQHYVLVFGHRQNLCTECLNKTVEHINDVTLKEQS